MTITGAAGDTTPADSRSQRNRAITAGTRGTAIFIPVTNIIESSFAAMRHRTVRSKGFLSNKTALAMIFKLAEAAEKSWRRLNGRQLVA
jgi:transposase-like protein